ncbi:hypothetical protein FOA52_008094 [Chlamydomonas sp. UWO 241]|nr:hypothetical protein FOA52_008094 [Chlamydomonas sp. UWO 241]
MDAATDAATELGQQLSGATAAKAKLLDLVVDSGRGYRVGGFLRGSIEEAQVAVESFAGPDLDYDKLEGKWRLMYTTAKDVLPILEAESRLAPPYLPSPVQVGEIYQRFSSVSEGIVENIIELSTPYLLQERNGITFTVKARYDVRSPHRIGLWFEEAQVGGVRISDGLEGLIAPAMLPRTSVQHQLLLAIKDFKLRFPFASAGQMASSMGGDDSPIAGGGNYQLTYLDDDMLIGRATALGGSFVFSRSA